MLLRLIEPDSGEVRFQGHDWLRAHGSELRALRRGIQMVFQDPVASLNPRMRVGTIVAEPLAIHEPRFLAPNAAPAPRKSSKPSVWPPTLSPATRTNFPAASASASASPAR